MKYLRLVFTKFLVLIHTLQRAMIHTHCPTLTGTVYSGISGKPNAGIKVEAKEVTATAILQTATCGLKF